MGSESASQWNVPLMLYYWIPKIYLACHGIEFTLKSTNLFFTIVYKNIYFIQVMMIVAIQNTFLDICNIYSYKKYKSQLFTYIYALISIWSICKHFCFFELLFGKEFRLVPNQSIFYSWNKFWNLNISKYIRLFNKSRYPRSHQWI